LLGTVLALALMICAGPLRAEYLLSPGDELRLRAMRWDALTATHQDWAGLSGSYVVGSEGWISIPLVGDILARGLTTRALAAQIAEAVQRRVGTPEPPLLGLEITAHAPVYVLGAVAAPGAYRFRPGLTVQQAVALAGGHAGAGVAAGGDFMGEAVRLAGEFRVLSRRIEDLEAKKRRLLADLALLADGGSESAPQARDLTDLEGRILEATAAGRRAEAESLQQLMATLEAELAALAQQIALRERQIAAAQSELAEVASLRDKGLAVNARVSSLTARASEFESQRLQLEIARLGASQQLNEAERALRALRDDALAERLAELNRTEGEIAEARIRLITARTLMDVTASRAGGDLTSPTAASWRHRVARVTNGKRAVVELSSTDPLFPGDTLEVLIEVDERQPAAPAAAR
jgi:hypothetical protein